MGISNFGGGNEKVVEGTITYVQDGYNLSRCSQCQNSTIFSFSVKDKLTKEIIENLKEGEVYCLKYKKVQTKWSQCNCVNAQDFIKYKIQKKGWLYGSYIESSSYGYNFKDIVSDEKSITTSINAKDSEGNQLYLGDIVCIDSKEIGVFIHDIKNNKDVLISLLSYPIFKKELTITENIVLPKVDKEILVISSLYELEFVLKKSITDFIKEVKSKKKKK